MAKKPKETEIPIAPPTAATPPPFFGLSPEGRALSQDDVTRMLGGGLKEVKRVDAPLLYASGVMVMGSGNDFTLIFTRSHPIENADGSINPSVMVGDTVAIVSITPQTAKDLLTVLQVNIPQWEAHFGAIKTPFTMQMEELKQKNA